MKKMLLLHPCEYCGKYAFDHTYDCPYYGDSLRMQIEMKKQEIEMLKLIIKAWQAGKYLDGKPLKLRKKKE